MYYTPKEAAELLADRINQGHYLEWVINRVRDTVLEEAAKVCEALDVGKYPNDLDGADCADAIRALKGE